jgi:hypothetical protein
MKLLAAILFPLTIIAQYNYCDKDIELKLTTQPNLTYNWNVDGYITTEQDATLTINRIGTFQIELEITNEYGCTSTDKRTIFADSCLEWTYYAPNAFVPDGENKTWIPVGENITIDLITIYTREGQVIFEGVTEWDGTYKGNKCMGAVYVYTCEYTTITGLKLRDLGRVTLVR